VVRARDKTFLIDSEPGGGVFVSRGGSRQFPLWIEEDWRRGNLYLS